MTDSTQTNTDPCGKRKYTGSKSQDRDDTLDSMSSSPVLNRGSQTIKFDAKEYFEIINWYQRSLESIKSLRSSSAIKILSALSTDSYLCIGLFHSQTFIDILMEFYYYPTDKPESEFVRTEAEITLSNILHEYAKYYGFERLKKAHIACMNQCKAVRDLLNRLLSSATKPINKQVEHDVGEAVKQLLTILDSYSQISSIYDPGDISYLFFNGIIQSILDILSTTDILINQNQYLQKTTRLCPYFMLKLVEQCLNLISEVIRENTFFFSSFKAYTLPKISQMVSLTLKYCSIDHINSFSCNCNSSHIIGVHIRNDIEKFHIFIDSCTIITNLCRYLRESDVKEVVADMTILYTILNQLVISLNKIAMNVFPSAPQQLISSLCALQEISKYILFISDLTEVNNEFLALFNENFLVFLSRLTLYNSPQFHIKRQNSNEPELDETDPFCTDIRWLALEMILLIQTAYIKNPNLMITLIEAKLHSRCLVLVAHARDERVLRSTLNVISMLISIGLGSVLNRVNMKKALEHLMIRLESAVYQNLSNHIGNVIDEISAVKESSNDPNDWDHWKSRMDSEKILRRKNTNGWIEQGVTLNRPQTGIEINSSNNNNKNSRPRMSSQLCTHPFPDCSILKENVFNNENISFNDDFALDSPLKRTKGKLNKNNSLNIKKDLKLEFQSSAKSSMFNKFRRNTTQLNPVSNPNRSLWDLVSSKLKKSTKKPSSKT